jgi:hypothetical protein
MVTGESDYEKKDQQGTPAQRHHLEELSPADRLLYDRREDFVGYPLDKLRSLVYAAVAIGEKHGMHAIRPPEPVKATVSEGG